MFTRSDKKWMKDNFVTKDDFKKSATKDDLKDFAKKDDLKNFATKGDLKDFATKDDLKGLASKDDLKKLEKKLDRKFTDLFDFLDKDVMETKRKITTIEQVLQIPSVS